MLHKKINILLIDKYTYKHTYIKNKINITKLKTEKKIIYIIIAWNHANVVLLIFKPTKTPDFLIMWMFVTSKEHVIIHSNWIM